MSNKDLLESIQTELYQTENLSKLKSGQTEMYLQIYQAPGRKNLKNNSTIIQEIVRNLELPT